MRYLAEHILNMLLYLRTQRNARICLHLRWLVKLLQSSTTQRNTRLTLVLTPARKTSLKFYDATKPNIIVRITRRIIQIRIEHAGIGIVIPITAP